MLWALATLGYRPNPAWLDAAWAAVEAASDQLAPPQLLQLTWALPVLGWAPSSGARAALLARGEGVLDTPRASLQRMRWVERAQRAAEKAAAAGEAAAAAV